MSEAVTARLANLQRRVSWPAGLVVVIVVALLILGGQRALAWQDELARIDDEKAAVAAATAEVEGLISVSDSTSAADLESLLDGATAEFRSELEQQAKRLRTALTKNKVTATGEVVSTAVVRLDDGRASVIVAAMGTVENKQTADAEPRNYRLRVDLIETDGRWLVSGLEFVA